MASIISTSSAGFATLPSTSTVKCTITGRATLPVNGGRGLRLVPTIRISKATGRSVVQSRGSKNTISCSIAAPETLQVVQSTIAKQLSVDESTVSPQTKFADLGADSLDTVEIMMALEEKFGVSIGEEGAANLSTVQDAADLIEKVKAGSA